MPRWHRAFAEVSNVSFRECKRGKVEACWMTGLGRLPLFEAIHPTTVLSAPQSFVQAAANVGSSILGRQSANRAWHGDRFCSHQDFALMRTTTPPSGVSARLCAGLSNCRTKAPNGSFANNVRVSGSRRICLPATAQNTFIPAPRKGPVCLHGDTICGNIITLFIPYMVSL